MVKFIFLMEKNVEDSTVKSIDPNQQTSQETVLSSHDGQFHKRTSQLKFIT